ncbi:MAG: DUF6456 domain-containing protein [Rhizobium sp.]
MTERVLTAAERKNLARLLRSAVRETLEIAAEEDGGDLWLSGQTAPPSRIPARLLRHALASGLLHRQDRRICAGAETRAYLRRAMSDPHGAGFGDQHRETVIETLAEEGARRVVRRNVAESPLTNLARLKGKDGQPFLDAGAIEAGERLAADFMRAGLQPRITSSWEPRLSGRVRGRAGGAAELSDSALGARERVRAAVEAMGPELSGVALDVCCFMKGLEIVERERQWPARSAKLMLRAALMALARHYAPPQRPAARRSHHWGTDDYRPSL